MADSAHSSDLLRTARRLLLVPPAGRAGDLAPALRRLRQILPGATLVPLAAVRLAPEADPRLAAGVPEPGYLASLAHLGVGLPPRR